MIKFKYSLINTSNDTVIGEYKDLVWAQYFFDKIKYSETFGLKLIDFNGNIIQEVGAETMERNDINEMIDGIVYGIENLIEAKFNLKKVYENDTCTKNDRQWEVDAIVKLRGLLKEILT